MTFTLYDDARLGLARDSLTGLSVADALGAQYFVPGIPRDAAPPDPVWEWTDDSEMACSIFAMLAARGTIDRDELAMSFARRCEPYRGYGPGAVTILRLIRSGTPWPIAASTAFDGQGSCGNGAAMRVAPLGAYFADSTAHAAAEAVAASEVTHAHPEGIAGAVAVAVAASLAAKARLSGHRPAPPELLEVVAGVLEAGGRVRRGLERALGLLGRPPTEAAYELGNGSAATAQDTVPFTLWAAATFLDDYPAAVRACVAAGGDMDTTAAIVGGIVAAHTGVGADGGVPREWIAAREPLPAWVR
ncbi:ADP-ribosylglycohydrolase [Micromonospora pattaloongensis]|uniref:ADP-ribosylglycohydrolase n=1 Tax=Micromonospora pattaloongensis TaxID=405436 RepID=A0A1H3S624_9ACTN|nr:ADP-ribosylglycohydrolase family protein [Micromonospora pattaloongensis]SDZ33354.1 ADP-ribosylglycohydrolase [Micromonospora pattaloongensis]